MEQTTHVLGADGGATHTRAVILDGDGNRLGAGDAAGSNPLVVGHEAAAEQLAAAAKSAAAAARLDMAYFDSACVGLAGIGRDADRRRMVELLTAQSLAAMLEVDHDAALALYGATAGEPGIICLAGTGAISFGMDAEGNRARADGWGRIMGDEGGGYDLAARALKVVARATEGRGEQTSLTAAVFAGTETENLDQLAAWLYDSERHPAEIAALARCVIDAASDGDSVALALVGAAARSLAESAASVARQLWSTESEIVVSYGGSLLAQSAQLRELFGEAVAERLPRVSIREPLHDAAHGAALRALRLSRETIADSQSPIALCAE